MKRPTPSQRLPNSHRPPERQAEKGLVRPNPAQIWAPVLLGNSATDEWLLDAALLRGESDGQEH